MNDNTTFPLSILRHGHGAYSFYTVNLLNAKWKVVPARISGWKKRVYYINHNLPGGV